MLVDDCLLPSAVNRQKWSRSGEKNSWELAWNTCIHYYYCIRQIFHGCVAAPYICPSITACISFDPVKFISENSSKGLELGLRGRKHRLSFATYSKNVFKKSVIDIHLKIKSKLKWNQLFSADTVRTDLSYSIIYETDAWYRNQPICFLSYVFIWWSVTFAHLSIYFNINLSDFYKSKIVAILLSKWFAERTKQSIVLRLAAYSSILCVSASTVVFEYTCKRMVCSVYRVEQTMKWWTTALTLQLGSFAQFLSWSNDNSNFALLLRKVNITLELRIPTAESRNRSKNWTSDSIQQQCAKNTRAKNTTLFTFLCFYTVLQRACSGCSEK